MKKAIVYVTANNHKADEHRVFLERARLTDGRLVRDVFDLEISAVQITETLSVDLREMVHEEVTKAYQRVRVPCFVEHAGLVFSPYRSFPGGLTKPMWNELGERFLEETRSAGRDATAVAAVGYCDGARVRTFTGETKGCLAAVPKGARDFYWDTIFVPADPDSASRTYAEIVEDPAFGLTYKVEMLSQSTKAKLAFLNEIAGEPASELFPGLI